MAPLCYINKTNNKNELIYLFIPGLAGQPKKLQRATRFVYVQAGGRCKPLYVNEDHIFSVPDVLSLLRGMGFGYRAAAKISCWQRVVSFSRAGPGGEPQNCYWRKLCFKKFNYNRPQKNGGWQF